MSCLLNSRLHTNVFLAQSIYLDECKAFHLAIVWLLHKLHTEVLEPLACGFYIRHIKTAYTEIFGSHWRLPPWWYCIAIHITAWPLLRKSQAASSEHGKVRVAVIHLTEMCSTRCGHSLASLSHHCHCNSKALLKTSQTPWMGSSLEISIAKGHLI